jgi:hypothetical protein
MCLPASFTPLPTIHKLCPNPLNRENEPDRNYGVRDQHSIVSFDRPFDNLGFLSEKFRQILLYVVRS